MGNVRYSRVRPIDSTDASIVIVAGVARLRIYVYQLFHVQDKISLLTYKDGSTAFTGAMSMFAGGAFFLPYTSAPWFVTSPGNDLVLAQTGGAQISGCVYYAQL